MEKQRPTFSRRGALAMGGGALAAMTIGTVAYATSHDGNQDEQPVALITGTSSGFGRLMAESFSVAGIRTIATMRDIDGRNAAAADELTRLARSRSLPLELIEIDVTDDGSVGRGTAESFRRAGRIDILVNNAAIVIPGPLELVPPAFFHRTFNTNVHGYHRVFAAVAPQMRERGSGYVIQFSSGLGRLPTFAGVAAYNLSKSAIETMSDNIASSEAPFGIDVTVVQPTAPYPTQLQNNGQRYLTEMLDSLPEDRRSHVPAFASQIAQIRERLVGDPSVNPQEVADGVLALIRMQPGTRPRRQIIGPRQDNVALVNEVVERAMSAQQAGQIAQR